MTTERSTLPRRKDDFVTAALCAEVTRLKAENAELLAALERILLAPVACPADGAARPFACW